MQDPKYLPGGAGQIVRANDVAEQARGGYLTAQSHGMEIRARGTEITVSQESTAVEDETILPVYLSFVRNEYQHHQGRLPIPKVPKSARTDRGGGMVLTAKRTGDVSERLGRLFRNENMYFELDPLYVGGGYVLSLHFSWSGDLEHAAIPVLWHVDSLNEPVLLEGDPRIGPKSNVAFRTSALASVAFPEAQVRPSIFEFGQDDAGKHWFGVLFVQTWESPSGRGPEFTFLRGNTQDKKLERVELPAAPPGIMDRDGTVGSPPWRIIDPRLNHSQYMSGYAPCGYCVGRGQAMILMCGDYHFHEQRVGEEGVVDYYYSEVDHLPPDKRMHLMRTRDFGATWTLEEADFLGRPGEVGREGLTQPSWRIVSWGVWRATQLGDGRIAVVTPVPRDGTPVDLMPPFNDPNLSLGLWISNPGGSGFSRVPWPGDRLPVMAIGPFFPYMHQVGSAPFKVIPLPVIHRTAPVSLFPGFLYFITKMVLPERHTMPLEAVRDKQTIIFTHDYGATWNEVAIPEKVNNASETRQQYLEHSTWSLTDPLSPGGNLDFGGRRFVLDVIPHPTRQFFMAERRKDGEPATLYTISFETDCLKLWRTNSDFDKWELLRRFSPSFSPLTYEKWTQAIDSIIMQLRDKIANDPEYADFEVPPREALENWLRYDPLQRRRYRLGTSTRYWGIPQPLFVGAPGYPDLMNVGYPEMGASRGGKYPASF